MLLATHSGSFHADDVFAYAVLRGALGPDAAVELVRTRNPDVLAQADIVWDVGGEYDAGTRRYDHHQRHGKPFREDGTPYSSAGLVWRHHGLDYLQNAQSLGIQPHEIDAVWEAMDKSVFLQIDKIDNGVMEPVGYTVADAIDDLTPNWFSDATEAEYDQRFEEAAVMAADLLANRLRRALGPIRAYDEVMAAYERNESGDPRILILPKGMPWQNAVHQADLPVLYVIYPDKGTGYMVNCVPPEPGSYGQKLPLPEEWAGLRDQELAEVSGVPDAVFAHSARFVGGARSLEGTLSLARHALDIGLRPRSAMTP